jgi:nucleoside 2-deoxyribosyltransferase
MNPEEQKCPICQCEATVSEAGTYPDFRTSTSTHLLKVNCSVCHNFFVSDAFNFRPEHFHLMHLVQGALRERELKTSWKSNILFLYNDQEVEDYNQKRSDPEKGFVAFTIESLLETVDIPKNPMQQLDRFLQNLAIMLGDSVWGEVRFDQQKDYPLAYAKDNSNAHQLCLEGVKLGYFRQHTDYIGITMKGWERIEELKEQNKDSKQGFVACWFDDSHDSFRKTIENGIHRTGFKPMSIKERQFPETIFAKAIGEIRKSRFIVVDLTEERKTVFAEWGFAMGIGIPHILVMSKSYKDKIDKKAENESKDGKKQEIEFYAKNHKINVYKDEKNLEDIVFSAVSEIVGTLDSATGEAFSPPLTLRGGREGL